jgi:hypothetical protein
MADQKITQLTALASAASTDVLPIVDVANTETKKITKADLLNGLQAELVSGTNIKTINSTSLLGSGDIAISANPAGTAGQIQFSDGSAFAADSNLFWDNTNKRLGVGTATPTHTITNTGLSKLQGIALGNVTHSNINSNEICSYNSMYIFNRDIGGSLVRAITISNTGAMISSDGSSTSSAMAHIKGSGSTSATTSLLVQNSSGMELLKVTDSGDFYMDNGNIWRAFGYSYLRLQSDVSTLIVGNSYSYFTGTPFNFGSAAPHASAHLQADSTTKGFLPPRMTTTQKNAISTPAAGLIVYDTDTNKLCCYNGTSWNDLF